MGTAAPVGAVAADAIAGTSHSAKIETALKIRKTRWRLQSF
jgi:hypothetical protein